MVRSARWLAWFLALTFGVFAEGQQGPAQKTGQAKSEAASAARPQGLTVDSVVAMVQGGLSEDLIIARIRREDKAFDLSPEEMIKLKQSGVSEAILMVMLNPRAEITKPAIPAPAASSTPATSPAPEGNPPAPPAAQSPAPVSADAPIPDEQGVYWAKGGKELIRVEGKAVSNLRTGSTLASRMTLGIKRNRVNAQLKGARSENRLKEKQPIFYLFLPEEASVGDYLLVRMAQRLDVRQIEIGQSTFWKQQSGVDHFKEVEFTHTRIKPRLYRVVPTRELDPGEYGFLVAAGIELKKPTGRIYDFGIDP